MSKTKFKSLKLAKIALLFLGFLFFILFYALSVNGEENYIYYSFDNSGNVRVVKQSDFSTVATMTEPGFQVWGITSNDDYIFASDTSFNAVFVYDKETYLLVETLDDMTNNARAVAVDSFFVYVGSWDYKTYVYRLSDFELVETLDDSTNRINAVFADLAYLYVAGDDKNVYVYSRPDFDLVATLDAPTKTINRLYADSVNLYVSNDDDVLVYDVSTLQLKTTLTDPTASLYAIDGNDNFVFVGDFASDIYVYSKETHLLVETIEDVNSWIWDFAIDDSNNLYVIAGDYKIYIFDLDDYSLTYTSSARGSANTLAVAVSNPYKKSFGPVAPPEWEPPEWEEGEPTAGIFTPHYSADTWIYVRGWRTNAPYWFLRFEYREKGESEWENSESWRQSNADEYWSYSEKIEGLEAETQYQIRVKIAPALPEWNPDIIYSEIIEFETGEIGDYDFFDEFSPPIPPEPPESWTDIGGWFEYFANYIKYLLELVWYRLQSGVQGVAENFANNFKNLMSSVLNIWKQNPPFSYVYSIADIINTAKETGGETEFPSFVLSVDFGNDTQLEQEILPFEEMSTNEYIGPVFTFLKSTLSVFLWFGFALYLFQRITGLIAKKSQTNV